MCITPSTLFICSKFDTDISANICRIGFYGSLVGILNENDLKEHKLKIFRTKVREGIIEKANDDYSVIIKDMFKKESKIEIFVNKPIELVFSHN